MEKLGSTSKATLVPIPAIAPVRDVEHGCDHLRGFISEKDEMAEKLTTAYVKLQDIIIRPLESQTTMNPKDPTKASVVSLRPTYLCLQCSTISTAEDRDAHSIVWKHQFSVESRSGCLYCGRCNDFIYDPTLERIRVQQPLSLASSNRKRKLSTTSWQREEDKVVLPNANMLSCQAGAPRGMFNLGQTCYMSVILQAMIHNPFMRNFFLALRHETPSCPVENCIACALTSSFADVLASEKTEGHGPCDLLSRSWKNREYMAGYHQQDAHEYFQAMLDQLHEASGCEMDNSKTCDCIYHQTFYGKLRSTVTCLECHNITTSEDPIIDLSLDLRHQVKKRKLDPKTTSIDVPLELSTCLKNYTSPEKLQVDAYTCMSAQCGNTPKRARKHLTIKKLPPTLCIQLKRYEQSNTKSKPQKLDTKLNFPLQLDMTPYTTRAYLKRKTLAASPSKRPSEISTQTPPVSPRSPGWYDLSCVVVHIGNTEAGHYLCYCRREDQWFKYDDHKVTLAMEKEVLNENTNAYLLFYVIRNLGLATEEKGKGKKGGDGVEKDDGR